MTLGAADEGRFLRGLRRGLARRCPECGRGRLFDGYLAVRPRCAECRSDNARFPSDDIPPYVTILLVGHLVVAPALMLDLVVSWPEWAAVSLIGGAIVALTLALLPFIKGGVIGVEWALRIEHPAGIA